MQRGSWRRKIKMRELQPVNHLATPVQEADMSWQRDFYALVFPTKSAQDSPDTNHSNGALSKTEEPQKNISFLLWSTQVHSVIR